MKRLITLLFTITLSITTLFGQSLLNEGFESNTMPPTGWTATSICTDPYWEGWGISTTAYAGNYAAFIDYSPVDYPHSSYLITPQLSLTGHKTLSFWYAANYPEYSSYTSFTLEISTTGTTPECFTVLQTIPFPANTSFVNFTYDLQAYTGQTVYLAFHVEDEYGTGVFIDEVVLYDIPDCFAPDNLTVTNTSYNSATLTWDNSPSSNSYLIQYVPANGSWDNALEVTTNDLTVSLNGLFSSTSYKARISSICAGPDTSSWSDPITFHTLCDPLTIAQGEYWIEDFESVSNYGSTPLSICWSTPQTSATYQTPYIYCGLAIASHSGVNSLELRGNNNETNIVVLPEFSNSLNTLKLKFFANTTASSAQSAGTLEVGYITDPEDPTTFTVLETVSPKSESYNRTSSAPYGPYYFADVNASGRIAIRFTSNSFSTSWNLDDISVGALAECMEPISLQSSNITSTSVDLNWIHNNGYLYDIFLWASGSTDTTVFHNVSIDNGPFTINTLNPGTSYSWTACTICDDTTYNYSEIHGHFNTTNASITLPYICDFEDTSYDYSEFSFSGYGTNQWYIGSATSAPSSDSSVTSTRSLYISNNQGLSNQYGGNNYSYAYASLDLNFPNDAMEYHLEFDLRSVGECGWDQFSIYLLNGGTSLPNSGAPSGQLLLSAQCDVASWSHYNLILPDVTGTSKRIVFYWVNDSYVFGQPPAAIDNIEISGNSCARPTHLTASNITDTEVSLSWQENATATSWTLHYKVSNSDLPYEIIHLYDSTHFVLQNLTPNTNYVCFVMADCGDDSSNPSNPISFRTQCSLNGIDVLPYVEDFNTYESIDGSDYVPCWSRLNSNSTHFVYVNHYDFESGCLDFHYTPNCYTIAVLPELSSAIPLNNLVLNLDARRHNLSSGALEVGAMTDPTDASTFEVIDTVPITSTYAWNNYTIYCNEYSGFGQYLAFRVNNAGNYTVAIDNLILDYLPGCLPPSGVTVTNITQTTANVSWNGNATHFKVYVIGNPDTIVYTTTQNSITIEDLEPSSTYSVMVQSFCTNDTSDFSSKASFHTACGVITITEENPWMESFENYSGALDAIELSPCWAKPIQAPSSSGNFPLVFNYANAAHSGNYSLELKGASNMVVLPEFTNDINTLQISLWLNTNADDAASAGYLAVGFITDVANPSTFVTVANIPATAFSRVGTDAAFTDYVGPFDFSAIPTIANQRIAFRYINNNYSDVSWNLDDIVVTLIPDCPSPEKHSVTITNITNEEATISWEDNDPSHETWCVFYRSTDNYTWQVDTVYNTKSLTITGLLENNDYEVYVITYCGTHPINPDATLVKSFTTTTIPTPLPYTTDFSQSDDLWRFNNGDCTNYWTIHNYTPSGNNYALYITHNGVIAGYDVTAASYVSAEKVFTVGQNAQIQIDFDIKIGGESSGTTDYDYMKMFLTTADQTFEADNTKPNWATTSYTTNAFNFSPYFIQSYFSPYDFSQTGSNTIHVSAIMSNPNPNPTANSVAKLVFGWANDNTGGTQPGAIISNLSVTAVACPKPTDLIVTTIGSNEADVYWLPGQDETSWVLEYKKSTSSMWNTITTNSNSYHLVSLVSNTQYDLRIQADCGDGTSQYETTTFSTTFCSASDQCPYIFHLSDSYGDGWNGASLNVIQNGTLIQSLTLADSYNNDFTLFLCNNSPIVLNWTSGLYDYECSFTVEGPDGTIIYSNSNLSGNATLFSFTTDCSVVSPCDAPVNLTASDITLTSANITWAAGNANAWAVEYKALTSLTWEPEIYVISNNLNLSNLISNTTYQLRVKANCEVSNWSDWSDVLIFNTLTDSTSVIEPTVITNSASEITQNSAKLNGAIVNAGNQSIIERGFEWKNTGATNFSVVYSNSTSPVFFATVTDLTPSTSYTFRAFVTTANATSYGEEMTFTTADYNPSDCDAPTGLDTTEVTSESISITWIDNADANEWNVRHRTQNGSWNTDVANITSYTISGLAENTTYYIQVQAVCGENTVSEWSNEISVTTTVGLNEHLFNAIKLYPNPATNQLTLEWESENNVTNIEVFDVYGKLIRVVETQLDSQQAHFNISDLANGMYFVRLTTEQGVATKPFVKK